MSFLGYRDDTKIPGADEPGAPAETRRIFLIVSLVGLGFFFLLDVLSWFTERGGIFSIGWMLGTVGSKPPVMDVDKSGLWLAFTIVSWLIVVGVSRVFDIPLDTSTRAKALLPAVAIIGGGFALDGAFGETTITHSMTRHGYSRCAEGDWAQGNGKSRVWFADYVWNGTECREHRT